MVINMKKSVKETVREAILPTVTELGYDIWDVTYSKIGADYHLEITIDSEAGMDLDFRHYPRGAEYILRLREKVAILTEKAINK